MQKRKSKIIESKALVLLRGYSAKRKLKEFIEVNTNSKYLQESWSPAIHQKRDFSFLMIFSVRRAVYPALFFIEKNEEEKYTKLKFFSKRDTPDDTIATLGQRKLFEISTRRGMFKHFSNNGIGLRSIFQYMLKDAQTGAFLHHPSFDMLYKLKDYIPPEWFFIYEDEVENDVLAFVDNYPIPLNINHEENDFYSLAHRIIEEIQIDKNNYEKYFQKKLNDFDFLQFQNCDITKPNLRTIFHLRNMIQPKLWFIESEEEIPENLTQFTSKRDLYDISKMTLGLQVLKEFSSTIKNLQILHAHTNIPISYFRQLIYTRKTEEGIVFRITPKYDFIMKMKDLIPADFWYIYPDEVSDDVKNMILNKELGIFGIL